MFLLRDAQKSDLPSIKRLAVSLNTVNLPNDEEELAALLDRSMKSFSGRIQDSRRGKYLFVLEDVATGKIAGTSLIIAQHGTFEAPHVFYEVTEREHYSASIDRHFRHQVLSIAAPFGTRSSPSCCRRFCPTASRCFGKRSEGSSPASPTRTLIDSRGRTRSSSRSSFPPRTSTRRFFRRRRRR